MYPDYYMVIIEVNISYQSNFYFRGSMGKIRPRGCSNNDKTNELEMDRTYPGVIKTTQEWPWTGILRVKEKGGGPSSHGEAQ